MPLRERRIYGIELLVSHALNERLHPRTLRLALGQLPVEISVCVTVDTVFGRSVCLPFIGVIESSRRQSTWDGFWKRSKGLLISTVFVRCRGRPDHVSGA